jgi:hypothetical protein
MRTTHFRGSPGEWEGSARSELHSDKQRISSYLVKVHRGRNGPVFVAREGRLTAASLLNRGGPWAAVAYEACVS